ncbi:MAG: hypothetical protein JW846_07510 [Dehalococcoidia bacterium]|nr:hypothetical protein [Dehalococcoidia bacterium]
MDVNQRVKVLEDEVKVLKAELKSVLMDIREQYLNNQNPFSSPGRDSGHGGGGNNGDEPVTPTVVVRESVIERDTTPRRPVEESVQADEPPSNGNGNGKKSAVMTETIPALTASPARGKGSSLYEGEYSGDGLDLAVIAGLTEWVDKTIQRIGKHRAEAIVEGLHSIGRLPGGMKDFLVRFVELSPDSEPERQLKAKDYLTVLSQLEGLLGKSGRAEMSLLSILNSDEASGWTKQ